MFLLPGPGQNEKNNKNTKIPIFIFWKQDAHVHDVRAQIGGVWTFEEHATKKTNFGSMSKTTVHALFCPVFFFFFATGSTYVQME